MFISVNIKENSHDSEKNVGVFLIQGWALVDCIRLPSLGTGAQQKEMKSLVGDDGIKPLY